MKKSNAKRFRSIQHATALSCLATLSIISQHAQAWDPIGDALTTEAKVKLNFRARYEDVTDEAPNVDDADAFTLRSRISYESGQYEKFGVFLEFDDVTPLMAQDYNDTVNGKKHYTVIADPKGTEVNQAYLSYAGLPDTNIKWGRQKITLDNERFIGASSFRQNEQTYDAISVTNKSLPKTTLFYANIDNVNTINGEQSPTGDRENYTNLFNAKFEGIPHLTLAGYVYSIDDKTVKTLSSNTTGLRASGKFEFGDETLKYAAEYATQHEAHENPLSYSADYYLAEVGYGISAISGLIGYEVLGADDKAKNGKLTVSQGFQTPLGTLHKFQGWADQFLGGGTGNIGTGIKDTYVGLEGKAFGLGWNTTYHQFDAVNDTKAVDTLGDEWNAGVEKKFDNYSVSVQYAMYKADDSTALKIYDKDKLWVTFQASF